MLGIAALAALSMTPVFAGGDKDAALAARRRTGILSKVWASR